MASFFDKFKKKAEEVAQGVYRQISPFDGGATYSNPRPQQQAPQRAPQQQAQGSAYIGARPQSQPVVNQSQMSRMLGTNRTNRLANNINTRIQAPKLQVNQPSYGNGLSGAFNQFKDKFDANTPQDQFKRQQVGQPQIVRPVQQQISEGFHQANKLPIAPQNVVKKAVNTVGQPMVANVDFAKAGVGQLTGNKQARNNALKAGGQKTLAAPKLAYNTLIKAPVVSAQAIGENAATAFSGDARRAEQAQTLLTDQLESQKLNAYKQARQGFQDQGQVNRFNKYADNLWNNAGQARADQINAQQDKYQKIDPVKNAALIADAGLTSLSFGVGGVTKQTMKSAAKAATEKAVARGLSKDVAMGMGGKAARANLIKNSAITGGLSAVQGAVTPYATQAPGTVKGSDVLKSTLLSGTAGVVLPAGMAKLGGGKLNLRPQLRATADEVLALSNFRSQMGGMIEPDVYSKGVAVAQKYGIDYGTPDGVSQIDNVIGSYRTFENQPAKPTIGQKINSFGQSLYTPLKQKGSLPLDPINHPLDTPGKGAPIEKTTPTKTRVGADGQTEYWTGGVKDRQGNEVLAWRTAEQVKRSGATPVAIEKTPTSSGSLSENAPAPSVSSPRSPGQKTTPRIQPIEKTQVGKQDTPSSNQSLSYPNSTPKTRTVKLNTDRLNPDSGYAGMAEMDKQTMEVVETMSNKDITRLSKDAGIDTKTNTPEVVKKKIAEQLNVRRDAVRYMNEAEVARKSGDLEGAKASMLKAAEAGRISRAQGTELAQQLQARRIIANELDTPQQRIFKLLDAAGVNPEAYVNRLRDVDFTNPKQVVEAYRDLVPAKKAEWLDTLRYNSMLSSPLTQAVNVFGNLQGVAIIAPIEKTLRGTIDAIGGVFGKQRRYAAGEGAAYAGNAIKNIGNATRNFRDALGGTGKYANPDFDDYNIPLATKGVAGATYKTLSFPMRVLDGMDKFFRTLAEGGEEAALSLREKKGIKLGGNKSALMEEEAAYRVFQQDLHKPGQGILAEASDSFASLIMSGRNSKNPIVSTISKFTVPFVKTINNINKQGVIEYSPLGIANMVGNTDKVTALTRATMGTAIFGISSMLLGSGDMTWAEPRNAEERARFRSEGKQPYAVKVGGKWIGFSKLHPAISFPMAMTAALDDAMNNKKIDQGNVDAILEAVSKFGNFLSDQSYAKSVGDTLGAIGGDKEAIAGMVSNNIQQVVPFRAFTGWLARMTDDLERKVDTTQGYFDQQVQMLMQQYPGLRQNTPTRDYQGTPIPANNQILNAFSPVRVTNDRGVNPIDAELDATKKPETSPLLTKSQLKEIETIALQKVRNEQSKVIATEEYKALPADERRKILANLESDIKVVAKQEYQAKNGVGEYALDYKGKQTKLTAKQKAIASGDSTASDKDIKEKVVKSKYSQEVQDFSKLSNAEKNAYFRRDPTKAKQLYDQAKQMDGELGKKTSTKTTKTTAKKSTGGRKVAKGKSTKGRKAPRGAMPKFATITKAKKLNLRVSKVKYAPVNKVSFKKKNTIKSVAKNKKIA